MAWNNKFKANKTRHAGRSFDSGAESQCFDLLSQLEKAGEVRDLRCQVTVDLTAGIKYRADFKFFDVKLKEEVWGEYKGFETPEWKIKLKLWRVFGPGRLRIFRGHYPRYAVEDVIPKPLRCAKCQQEFLPGTCAE